MKLLFLAATALLLGCSDSDGAKPTPDSGQNISDYGHTDLGQDLTDDLDSQDAGSDSQARTCQPLAHEPFDQAAADRGYALLTKSVLGRGIIPNLAIQNLWIVWGGGRLTGQAYWSTFRKRYGFHEAPFDNGSLPMGFRDAGGTVAVTCLGCHGGVVAGQTIIGAANTTVDYETFYDDLVRLNELAPTYGFPSYPVPFDLDGFVAAAGVSDSMGLAMRMSERYAPGTGVVNTELGFQRPAAWWTVGKKERLYSDGIGPADGHRTMMAMLLAFGMNYSELQGLDDEIADIAHYIRSLQTPCWQLSDIDENLAEQGQVVFDAECASCHGSHARGAVFPNAIYSSEEVGTDDTRASQWGEAETAWVNASWFGSAPFTDTDGYLAQPLNGIWARAPYFHNGSVPDLAGVLLSSDRPSAWRRTGSARSDYDVSRVGWRYETVANPPSADTATGRQVYDTERPGLSNAGHTYGDPLSENQRAALLEYLRTL